MLLCLILYLSHIYILSLNDDIYAFVTWNWLMCYKIYLYIMKNTYDILICYLYIVYMKYTICICTLKYLFIVLAYCLHLSIHDPWLHIDEYAMIDYDSDFGWL